MTTDWNTPLVVAVFAAAVAGTANAIVAVVNGIIQRSNEAAKAESDLVLEVIRTGNIGRARENLSFLLQSGLISGKARSVKLKEYLDANPGSGPVLPAANERYSVSASAALTPEERTELQSILDVYIAYLDKHGFARPPYIVPIDVRVGMAERESWYSYYNPNTGEIKIDASVASDPDFARREYSHFVLVQQRPDGEMANPSVYLLESDLADYFVCSFADRPTFAPMFDGSLAPGRKFRRTLDNRAMFAALEPPDVAFVEGREVWGGAFWEIRQRLGSEKADRLLATAWKSMDRVGPRQKVAGKFLSALLAAAGDDPVAATRDQISAAFRERGFPLPANGAKRA